MWVFNSVQSHSVPFHSIPSISFREGVCLFSLHSRVNKLQDCFLSQLRPSSHSFNANFPHVLKVPTKENITVSES